MDTLLAGGFFLVVLFTAFDNASAVDEFKSVSADDAAFSSVFQTSGLERFAISLKSQEETVLASGADVLVGLGTVLSFWVVKGVEVDAGAVILEKAVLTVGAVSV